MHLSFNTLDELDAFVEWAGYQKRTKYALQQLLAESNHSESLAGCDGEAVEQQPAQATEPSETSTTAPEGTKRKRRAKAEIEAEKAAASPADWPFTLLTPAKAVAAEVASTPPVEFNAAPSETLTDNAKASIAQTAAKMGVVDAAKHLDQCRAFIQAHGMTAYAAAGALVELTSSPVGFDDAQRALHSAALEYWATANAA